MSVSTMIQKQKQFTGMNYENAAFNFQAFVVAHLPLKTFNGFFGKNCYQTSDKICTTRWATCAQQV